MKVYLVTETLGSLHNGNVSEYTVPKHKVRVFSTLELAQQYSQTNYKQMWEVEVDNVDSMLLVDPFL